MMSVFSVAADLVVALFVALGALLAFRWHRLMWAHLPAAAWGVIVEFSGWECPLTPLENALRLRAGETAYSGDFIQHYVMPALPANLTRDTQLIIGSAAFLVNVVMYGCLFRRHRDA